MNRLAFAIIISLLAVPTSAHARVWYYAGMFGDDPCSVAKLGEATLTTYNYDGTVANTTYSSYSSPADEYEHEGGSSGNVEIVDKGDTVEVRYLWNRLPDHTVYFKSKAACERIKRATERQHEQEEKRENERLDRYR